MCSVLGAGCWVVGCEHKACGLVETFRVGGVGTKRLGFGVWVLDLGFAYRA